MERGCVVTVSFRRRLRDGVEEGIPVAVAVGSADCVVGAEVEVVEERVSGVRGKMGCVGLACRDGVDGEEEGGGEVEEKRQYPPEERAHGESDEERLCPLPESRKMDICRL